MSSETPAKQSASPAYAVSNIRFEPEEGGFATIWFDLDGASFAEPEAMRNMFVEFGAFQEHLTGHHPAPGEMPSSGPAGQMTEIDRLESANFDWAQHLCHYIEEQVDVDAAYRERLGWLKARQARAAGAEPEQAESEWQRLTIQAETASPYPSWDDVVHALIDSLNATAVELYPELLDYDKDGNNRLRDMIESHGERLANQLVALTRSVREGSAGL